MESLTRTKQLILTALLESNEPRYGSELSRATGVPSGSLYPALHHMTTDKWIEGFQEAESAENLGRPRRRYYRITGAGAAIMSTVDSSVEPTLRAWGQRRLNKPLLGMT